MRTNRLLLPVYLIISAALFFGCKKDPAAENVLPPAAAADVPQAIAVNDAEQVTAGVYGYVTDESNTPLSNAIVTSGSATTTTNSLGMFYMRNISVSKNNGSVTVKLAGYFNGIRSFKANAGNDHFVRIQMMPKNFIGNVSGTTGGAITLNGGATVTFPANAVVTSAGAAYTGTVRIYGRWIDPSASNLSYIIPGDLRGINTNGTEAGLQSYGMTGVEMQDASGNILKIAPGKKAAVNFPIPASMTGSAPDEIQLWHFDEASARWKEEGTATKSGSTYLAQVDKFSFWNCDARNDIVLLDFTLLDANGGLPLSNTLCRLRSASGITSGYGYTNNIGFVKGGVPKNMVLTLDVLSACGTVIYSQQVGPFSTNTSHGNISVSVPAALKLTFTGTLKNCSNAPVTDGYFSIMLQGGGNGFVHPNSTGSFAFTIINCGGLPVNYSYQAVDATSPQQPVTVSGTATASTINLNDIIVCSTAAPVSGVYYAGYESYGSSFNVPTIWTNTTSTSLSTTGQYSGMANSAFISGNDLYVSGSEYNGLISIAKYWKNGIPVIIGNGVNSSASNGIFVSGSDVYNAGITSVNNIATLVVWKNGTASTWVTSTSPNGVLCNGIFVSGTDVYVCGQQWNGSNYVAKVWKNGTATNLSAGTSSAMASSVYVDGTDVYVSGNEYDAFGDAHLKIWKNGSSYITGTAAGGGAQQVCVSGGDLYYLGSEYGTGGYSFYKVWKNGTAITTFNTPGQNINPRSMVVLNGDVYVGGTERIGLITYAKGWKNGIPVTLSNGSHDAFAVSVAVKP